MRKGLEQTLLQGGHTKGPKTCEKILNIASLQTDANKTTMRYHFTLVRMAITNQLTTCASEVVEKREP